MKKYIRERFISSDKGLIVKELIDYLEDELLNFEDFPEEYLEFFKEVFSSEPLFSSHNSWKILHFLTSENLAKEQFYDLASVITDNFFSYSDYMLCDMSCDFIARTCSPNDSLSFFEILIDGANNDVQRRSILVGLNIILTHKCENDEYRKRTQSLADRIPRGTI